MDENEILNKVWALQISGACQRRLLESPKNTARKYDQVPTDSRIETYSSLEETLLQAQFRLKFQLIGVGGGCPGCRGLRKSCTIHHCCLSPL